MLTAIVVDDQPFIRSAVHKILSHENINVVAEADSSADVIQLAEQYNPDLLIMDISTPTFNGLEAMNKIQLIGVKTKIIVLTAYSPNVYCRRCIEAGASSFISKTAHFNDLSCAIKAVSSGYSYFPDLHIRKANIGDNCTNDAELIAKLSNRELLVLQQLARGDTNKTISENLLLSSKTVSTYKIRLSNKLNIKSLVRLADFATRNNLI